MDHLIATFKALSDRNRLRIVSALLKHEELCACQLTELIQVKAATTSRHMKILISSGIVNSRKAGRWVYYRYREEQNDLELLIGWVKSRLSTDPDAALDAEKLKEITSCDPEELCKNQRA